MPEKRWPGWMTGCSIGCGVIVLIAAGAIAGGYFFLKGTISDFEQADAVQSEVREKFGDIGEFHPEADGAIPPERVEAFLKARETAAPARAALEETLDTLSGEGNKLSKVAAGFRLLGRMAEHLQVQNDALLQSGISVGEYYYIYTLAYYAYLEKAPADGPPFKLVGDSGYVMEEIENLDEDSVREYRGESVRRGLNRPLLSILRNQLADLETNGTVSGPWYDSLQAEIAAMEKDASRLPWQDGLPEVIESSLAPYRDRLEESYSAPCNAIEAGVARR